MAGNVIYAVSGSSELQALDARDGKKLWGYPVSIDTIPAISENLVYAIRAGGGLVALDASNGRPAWHSAAYFTTGPVVGAKAVYIADATKIYALQI
jgi:outer membrane protein assembly factor BamB